MDLDHASALLRPDRLDALPATQPGDAFVAGGTWLFSEAQPGVRRLVDLGGLGLSGCSAGRDGVLVGATCTLAGLERAASRRDASNAAPRRNASNAARTGTAPVGCVAIANPGGAAASAAGQSAARAASQAGSAPWPEDWLSAGLVERCCRMLASAPVRALATVGGNLCLALPASPVAAMAVALDASVQLRAPDGTGRVLPARALVLGERRTALQPGELLCALHLPAQALAHPWALRRGALSPLGRSAVLALGQRRGSGLVLTLAACLPRPRRLCFRQAPDDAALLRALGALDDFLGARAGSDPANAASGDPGGDADWRRALAGLFAREIRDELFACA